MITRVRGRSRIVDLRTKGVRVRRGGLALSHLDDGPSESTGVVFAIPRRVGTAVRRNQLRRRLRAILVELDRNQPELLPGGALLVSAGPDSTDKPFAELMNEMVRLLDDLHLRRTARP